MENDTSLVWRWVYGALGIILGGLIIWASFAADIAASFGAIVADPWGLVAIADLYIGFFIFWAMIFLVDGVKPTSFIWAALLLVLGNVLAVVWLILRWKTLIAVFKKNDA